jgi:hypothetical protein
MDFGYDIVFPFYEDYNYLKGCITKINNQTILPKNLIFIDDGNKNPNLKKIIKKILNKKIKLIFIKHRKNFGPQKAIENSLTKITSKFYFFIAADDIIYKNFAEENIKLLNKYPEAPYVFSNIIINNEINKKIYKIDYGFLKKSFYFKNEVKNILKNHQFKIYHNTVVFNSSTCKKNNISKIKYGRRVDMLNLLFLAFKFGFIYLNKNLSEFTIRKNQWGKTLSDDYLINELLILKQNQKKFYNFFITTNMHYDLSIFSIPKLIKKKLSDTISLKWVVRSIKFFLWKKLRFILPANNLNFLFKLFN